MKLAQKLQMSRWLFWNYLQMSEAEALLSNHNAAAEYAERSMEFSEFITIRDLAYAQTVAAKAYLSIGNYNKALEASKQAVLINQKFTGPLAETWIQVNKALTFFVEGDLIECSDLLEKIKKATEKMGYKAQSLNVFINALQDAVMV